VHGLGRHRSPIVLKGGILRSYSLSDPAGLAAGAANPGELSFIQISDSHMGFDKAANPDVVATLRLAVEKINAGPHLNRIPSASSRRSAFTWTHEGARRPAAEPSGPDQR